MSRKNLSTRKKILDSSLKLLEGVGADAVRMSDIAKLSGISRQALYLHFRSRAELLIATTRHIDEIKQVDKRLQSSRDAKTGVERLEAFIAAWGNYIPEVFGVIKALMAIQAQDEAARAAWDDRLGAIRHGCEAVVSALEKDGDLSHHLSNEEATDLLMCLVSVENWEYLICRCNWSQKRYLETIQTTAKKTLTS